MVIPDWGSLFTDDGVASDRRAGFVIIPAEIMKLAPTIGSAAVLVYAVLAQHSDEDGVCWPSVGRVAEIAGISERAVRRHLRTLEGHRQIMTETRDDGKGQTSNSYRLLTTQQPPDKIDTTPGQNEPSPRTKAPGAPGQKRQGPPDKSARGTRTIEQEPDEPDSKNKNQRTRKAAPSMSVLEVWEYYRTKRPKVRVLGADVEKEIKARLKKFTVEEICRAIDGNFRSPYHCGQNDRQTEYHELELIVRNDAKVNMFLAVPENNKSVLSAKNQRNLAALEDFMGAHPSEGDHDDG